MQGAMDIPGLDALSVAEFAGGREAAKVVLEGEGGQGSKPVKPRGRIGDEGKHPLSGSNDDTPAIGPIFDERERTGARSVRFGKGRGLSFSGDATSRGRGSKWERGKDSGLLAVPLLLAQQCQSQLGDVLLQGSDVRLQERELMAQISIGRGWSRRGAD